MKHLLIYLLVCAALLAGEISFDHVASKEQTTSAQEVWVEGMKPIYAKDIAEGSYEVTVDSSSSMFKVTKAELTVAEGKMTAVLTLSGDGYLTLFMGTGVEAAASDRSSYVEQAAFPRKPFSQNSRIMKCWNRQPRRSGLLP